MLSQSEITRLLDVANAACHHGHVLGARTILAGVLADKPDHIPAILGFAYTYIVVDDFATAEQIVSEQVLAHAPDDADAKALLGFVYSMTQRPAEARALLQPLANGEGHGVHEKIVAMAQEVLATL